MAFGNGDKTTPRFAFLKLSKASSLNLRDLNFNNVSLECLKFELEPSSVNILYSGLKGSIWNCSLLIISDSPQYSKIFRRNL